MRGRPRDRRGVFLALAAAALFGLSTPFAKGLLRDISPVLLAGLLYAGSGLGLALFWALRPSGGGEARLVRRDVLWLAGAILAGGVFGPVLLMWGLRASPASSVSLLHRHAHDANEAEGEPHAHEHVHEPLTHSHPHYPDIHHRHRHGRMDEWRYAQVRSEQDDSHEGQ